MSERTPVTAVQHAPIAVEVDCPAKTNLTLYVGASRAEWGGRHELDTLYCAIGVYDRVRVTRTAPGSGFAVDLAGHHLGDLAASDADLKRNHATLALFAMAQESGLAPDVVLSIEKNIPVGAGLAGGSADAAATILALNALWELDWPMERLQRIAATLGADMPFCLTGGFARGTGYGEIIENLDESSPLVQQAYERGFTGYVLVGAYEAELHTPQVYAKFDEIGSDSGAYNDLQKAAIALHPRSGEAIRVALQSGATSSFVSGSGPSVIACAKNEQELQQIARAWQRSACVDRIIRANAPAVPIVHIDA